MTSFERDMYISESDSRNGCNGNIWLRWQQRYEQKGGNWAMQYVIGRVEIISLNSQSPKEGLAWASMA